MRLFPSLHGYRRDWLRGDLVAGLTVWAVLVPESLAYATIAGVSPVVGLYAAPGALLVYAAFGSSRHLVVGPMAATAALSAGGGGGLGGCRRRSRSPEHGSVRPAHDHDGAHRRDRRSRRRAPPPGLPRELHL